MNRVNLTDGSGWFDTDSAECYEERTRREGNHHVSLATGSQWEHEALYRTASGDWILNWWSDWRDCEERYELITESEAMGWLIRMKHADVILKEEPESEPAKELRQRLADTQLWIRSYGDSPAVEG